MGSLLQVEVQRRTLVRLGDLDAFWSGLNNAMRSHLDAMVRDSAERNKGKAHWEAPILDSA
jgi:hypothetical protein